MERVYNWIDGSFRSYLTSINLSNNHTTMKIPIPLKLTPYDWTHVIIGAMMTAWTIPNLGIGLGGLIGFIVCLVFAIGKEVTDRYCKISINLLLYKLNLMSYETFSRVKRGKFDIKDVRLTMIFPLLGLILYYIF